MLPVISDALAFLKRNNTAVIATSYRNTPYASTVYYLVDDHFNFYFTISKNTDKYLNLGQNSRLAVVVGTGPKHITVQARGHATGLIGGEREKILNDMAKMRAEHNITVWPLNNMRRFNKRNSNSERVFKFTPQHLTFMNLDDDTLPASRAGEYHQIIPRAHH